MIPNIPRNPLKHLLNPFWSPSSDDYELKNGLWQRKTTDDDKYYGLGINASLNGTYPFSVPISATTTPRYKILWGTDEEQKNPEPRQVQGPLYGWRWWRLTHLTLHGWRLQSTARDYVWHGPTTVAHAKPRWGQELGFYPTHHTEGIHCYNNKSLAISRLADTVGSEALPTAVLGCVEVSGTVVKHEHGYRAERATIQGLTMFRRDHECLTGFGWMKELIEPTPEQITDLETAYQVDVVVEDAISGDQPTSEYWTEYDKPTLAEGPEERTIDL